jgi:hypothetical protein
MKFFNDITNDKITRLGYLGTFGIMLVSLFFVIFCYNKLPPFIPIFNQLSWGEQRLGATATIFLPILIAFLIFIFNLFLSSIIYGKLPLVSRILAATSLSISILAFLFIVRTIQLVL